MEAKIAEAEETIKRQKAYVKAYKSIKNDYEKLIDKAKQLEK